MGVGMHRVELRALTAAEAPALQRLAHSRTASVPHGQIAGERAFRPHGSGSRVTPGRRRLASDPSGAGGARGAHGQPRWPSTSRR
jgi:hypothetical protein